MEKKTLFFCEKELEYFFEYKKIKNINLRLKPDASVSISAPSHIPVSYIEDVIKGKWDWIFLKQAEIQNLSFKNHKQFVSDGKTVFILGREYTVSLIKSPHFFIQTKENKLLISSGFGSGSEELKMAYLKWLRQEAQFVFQKLLDQEYEKIKGYGVISPRFVVRNMNSRWGSCSVSKNKICLNLQLMKKSTDCIRQVIIHELVHFIYPNHSKDFYNLLTKLIPDWKQLKVELEQKYVDGL